MVDRTYTNSALHKRLSRRRVLQAGLISVAGVGAASILGCGSRRNSGRSATPVGQPPASAIERSGVDVYNGGATPRAGGRFHDQVSYNFDSFDPHLGIASAASYFPRLYNVLVNQSSTRPEFIVNDLSETFESPDATTWNFKIRPGVRIAPNDLGVPDRAMDADDVVPTFARLRDEARATNGAFVKQYVESVSATGNVVTIKTTRPYAWFLNRVGIFLNTIPPRELLASEAMLGKMRNQSAGGGPFRLVESTEGDGARFERNPNYYGRAASGDTLPYVDGIDIRIVTDRATARTGFLGNQFDTYSPANQSEADDLMNRDGMYVVKQPAFTFVSIAMQPERDPFRDPRARRAVSRAINRQQIVDLVYGGDARANGLVHWPLGSYALDDESLARYQPFDLPEARKLVEAVGGIRFKLTYPQTNDEQLDQHVPIIIEQLRSAGIEVEPEPQELTTWLGNYRTLNYAMSISSNQTYETPEIPLDFHTAAGPVSDRSYVIGLGDPELEAAVKRTKETLDGEGRIAAVRDAQRVIYANDPAFLPLVSPYDYTAFGSRVKDMPGGVGSTANLINTWWLDS